MKRKNLLIAAALAAACNLPGEVIERWTFEGTSPEVGVNGGTMDVWQDHSPNSVPTPGVLRYANYADSSTVTFANPIDTTSIRSLKMTIEVTDLQFNASEMIRFIFDASGTDPEVEFTAWSSTTHTFAPDVEYNRDNDDLDVTVVQLIGEPLGGPLLMTIVWDFVDNTMSFATSGMVETYGEKTAVDDMAAIIGTITGFRIDGTNSNNATAFVNLDTVTVEVNAGQVEARTFDFIEDFENGKHAFIPMGHVLEVASVADARSGDFVMVAQLTNASAVPDSTGVSLFQTQWFFETDQEYWVGMSTKLGDDFNYGSFDDQGVLVEWNYYNWENNDDTRPRPLVLRYTGDVVEIDSELIGLSGLKTVCSAAIDEWVDWVFHVKIAASGGIFEVWRNGVKVVDWAGDNCLGHNPDGAYLNYGLYSEQYDDQAGGTRMPVGYSRTVFHDEVRLDDADGSYASVTADGVLATIQPAQYETFQPPAAGQWFTDPAFGTRIKRLTDEQNVYVWNGERAMFSPDDQYFVIALNQPNRLVLFDGRTGAFLRDLSLSLPDYSIVRWWYDEVNDKQMLAYASGTQLVAFNVDNEAEGSVVLHDFGEQIGDSNGRLCNGDGNDFDDAGDWLLINAGDKMFPFNLRTLTKGVEKVMVASDWDYCTMSPSGDYIVGVGQVGSAVTDKGVFIWNRDWSGQRRLSPTGTHIDLGYLNGKEECLIARINKTNDGMDWWNTHNVSGESMLAVRLSDGEIFEMFRSTRWFSPIISAVRGSNSRHTYLAIPEHTLDPAIEWHRYFGELVQVSLDAESGFAVRRFAHHRCRQSVNGSHWTDQPEAWINHTGDRLFFRSNMDNYIEAGKHDLYMIELED